MTVERNEEINLPWLVGRPRLKQVPGKLCKSEGGQFDINHITHQVLMVCENMDARTVCPIHQKAQKGSFANFFILCDKLSCVFIVWGHIVQQDK